VKAKEVPQDMGTLREKKGYFFPGTSGMLMSPLHISFESTLPSSFGTLLMIRLVP
jgi:hypothetical protein